MNIVNKKRNILLPKVKKDRKTQFLRDPVDDNLFIIFFAKPGKAFKREKI